MIDKSQTEHIAKLANLKLTEGEIEKLSLELSAILDYVEKLKQVNIDGIEPMSHSLDVSNVIREDIAKESEGQMNIVGAFPKNEKRFLKVKSVFNHGD